MVGAVRFELSASVPQLTRCQRYWEIMKAQSTEKSTVAAWEIELVDGCLAAIRRKFQSECPAGFQWALLVDQLDLVVSWAWEGGNHYAGEIRARSVSELLSRWERVDWARERAAAVSFRGCFARV